MPPSEPRLPPSSRCSSGWLTTSDGFELVSWPRVGSCGERMVFLVERGVGVRMVEAVGGGSRGGRKFERRAVSLRGDGHEDAVRLRGPEQGDGDLVVGPLIELANHVAHPALVQGVYVSERCFVG